ncbi:VTT domain-containing protein [Candidatus Fermentibacterales bacterium]|nr:VTT domain-containing protein [Candidatus Fermentibacterales bacterium]
MRGRITRERAPELADNAPAHPAYESMKPSTWVFGGIMIVLGVFGVLLMLLKPQVHPLWTMFFYSIPSNCAISVFPHEPAMILYGKTVNAWQLSIAATLGTIVAAFLDYRFFSTILNIEVTASRYREKPFYRKARKWFYKAPFLSLIVAGASPIPFFPFKFLVYASRYPYWKFLLAVAIGRFPRYVLLALVGYTLDIPAWIIITGFALLVVSMYSKKMLDWARRALTPRKKRGQGPRRGQPLPVKEEAGG